MDKKTNVGIIGCGYIGGALKKWQETNNPLGKILAPMHELNVLFRGFEEKSKSCVGFTVL